jgi:hypothetical protein
MAGRQAHASRFAKVLDARKQPISAFWVRNGRYSGQLKEPLLHDEVIYVQISDGDWNNPTTKPGHGTGLDV